MPAPAAPPAESAATGAAPDRPWVPKPTVSFPATGLGEYRMPADAEMAVLKTEAEVYQIDLDVIREHWDELSDDELVEQAVREYAAMLGRKQLLFEKYGRAEAERSGDGTTAAAPAEDGTGESRAA